MTAAVASRAALISEAKLRALLKASSDVIYPMSPDWTEMRQLDGRGFLADATRPTIRWWDEYIYPEDRPHIQSVIDEAVRAKDVFELEHRVRRADGTPGWTFSRAIPVLDDDGEIVEWLGAASDVTGRHRAEEALRLSEERLSLAAEAARLGVWDWDLATDRVVANDRLHDQFDLPRGEPVAATAFTQRIHPDDRPRFEAQLGRAMAPGGDGRYAFEFRVSGASGRTDRWLSTYGRVYFDGEGVARRPVRVLGATLDIGERKRA